MNVLAIGAHPDDLDVLCGGTLIRYHDAGAKVVMCSATDGRGSPWGDPEKAAAVRRKEAQKSADAIGAEWVCLGIPDARLFDDMPTRLKFIQLFLDVSPDIIITHTPDDYHADHIMTSRLVTETVQMAWSPAPELHGQPVRKSIPVAFMAPYTGMNFLPEDYVDVSEVWEKKVMLTLNHRSQYLRVPDYDKVELKEPFDQYSFYRLTRIVDEFYGQQCGCHYAEGFRWWRAAMRVVARRLLP